MNLKDQGLLADVLVESAEAAELLATYAVCEGTSSARRETELLTAARRFVKAAKRHAKNLR